jgi:hypothetical protein
MRFLPQKHAKKLRFCAFCLKKRTKTPHFSP